MKRTQSRRAEGVPPPGGSAHGASGPRLARGLPAPPLVGCVAAAASSSGLALFFPGEEIQRGSKSLPEINAHHVVGISPELTYFSIS